LNGQAPSSVAVGSSEKRVIELKDGAGGPEQVFRSPRFPLTLPIKVGEGETTVQARFVLYYCESEKESLCYFKEARLTLPVKARKGAGSHQLTATYKLSLK
jgi:hypothetical protein